MSDFRRIVFVCSGNICRSPMAEALARSMVEDRDFEAVFISAGTLGIVGRKPSTNAVRALEEQDVELSGHVSQGIDPNLAAHADHIAVMTPKHVDYFEREAPELVSKLVRLWNYGSEADATEGITDPVGQDLETFRTTRDRLIDALEGLFDAIEANDL